MDIPLTAEFNELMHANVKFFGEGTTEDYLKHVNTIFSKIQQWQDAEKESERLQQELEKANAEISCKDRTIVEIRRHMTQKIDYLKSLEVDKHNLEMRISSAESRLRNFLREPRLSNDVRERLIKLLEDLGVSRTNNDFKSPCGALDAISEAETTDLSITQSEDDLDVSITRNKSRRRVNKIRDHPYPTRSSRKSETTDAAEMIADKLIATTVVTFPKDGSILAKSSIEANGSPHRKEAEVIMRPTPSAPPISSPSESDLDVLKLPTHNSIPLPNESPRFGRTLSSGGAMAMKSHTFCVKTVFSSDTCIACSKRIKFTQPSWKCRDCPITCHPACKDRVPLPCVQSRTPSSKNKTGTIADFVPDGPPLVPGLIQHCINEIEIRGLNTIGLYRVSGPEKEVKELRDKFLRKRTIPNLADYDIHSVCCCMKNFLRSLQEPLVGRWYWKDFALASEISDRFKRQTEIERIIKELPPPNQDTLAFVVLHLQRVAECPEIKMPVGNLSKIFGPTIVGCSEKEIDPMSMAKEVKKQQIIVETLFEMSSEFWRNILYRRNDQAKIYGSGTFTRSKARLAATSTPLTHAESHHNGHLVAGKKIYFSDDSPKEPRNTRKRRHFFD